MTVKILNRSGELLVEYDVENIRDADLTGADLTCADLRGDDLTGATLAGAALRNADLTRATLAGAALRGVDLTGADLTGADLRGADLRGADLMVITWMYWTVYITTGHIRIGCQSHTLEKWKNFTDDQISAMDSKALDFWKENKDLIIGLCERLEKK